MKLLTIAIFAQLDSPTITEQLVPTLRERGHTVDIIDLSTIPEEDFASQPEIQALTRYDLVYYRSGLETNMNSERIIQLEAFLKTTSTKMVNLHYTKHPLAHAKIYETQQAELNGLTIPKSVYLKKTSFSDLSNELGLPFISKTNYGTNGIGVRLIKTEQDFDAVKEEFSVEELLFQAFIPHDFEYRVHIMNGEILCIWKKAPAVGDFRSNEAQGGEMLTADSQHTPVLTKLAKKTFEIFDFEIFVADFMLDKNTNEFYFTEINLNPGWGKTDLIATGVDVISLTADYFEELCS